MIRVYLDNCCFNRPFDDLTNIQVKLETEAKLYIQEKIREQSLELVWSFILEFENSENPNEDRKTQIKYWKELSSVFIHDSEIIRNKAREFVNKLSIKPKDALHISCAIHSNSNYLITTDYKLSNKNSIIQEIELLNPIELINILERKYE